MPEGDSAWGEVWEVVRQIPAGQVLHYGGVAGLLLRPLSARAVGWALRECPADVPWHRVVNVRGECSTDRAAGGTVGRQRALLEAEGVCFVGGRVDMGAHAWDVEDDLD